MRSSRGGQLRLIRSFRGSGTLLWGRSATRPVSYSIDIYAQGSFLTADGDVRGRLDDLVGKRPANLRLRLDKGEEARVLFGDISADTASIEIVDPGSLPTD